MTPVDLRVFFVILFAHVFWPLLRFTLAQYFPHALLIFLLLSPLEGREKFPLPVVVVLRLLIRRIIPEPDGEIIEVDPLEDLFCIIRVRPV